jgi:glycine/D-amino acid oxidase-like deaminating enzyme
MSIPRTASVIVIGGGVVGCSIAYHLAGTLAVRMRASGCDSGGPRTGAL